MGQQVASHQVKCPTCNVLIPEREVADGWCENCGKKIPPFALTSAGLPSHPEDHLKPASGIYQREEVEAHAARANRASDREPAPSRSAPARPTAAAYAIMIGFIVFGAIAAVILEGGKSNWVWLGCGIGAGLGAAIAQATGQMPRGAANRRSSTSA